jgi:hypothetical protein
VRDHGNPNVPLPPGPPFFRYSDAAEASRLLGEVGFQSIGVHRLPSSWRLSGPEELFRAMVHGTARSGALLRAQTPEAFEAIRAEVVARAGAYRAEHGGVVLPMPAVLAVATKL